MRGTASDSRPKANSKHTIIARFIKRLMKMKSEAWLSRAGHHHAESIQNAGIAN